MSRVFETTEHGVLGDYPVGVGRNKRHGGSPFWENVVAAQFRYVAGSIGSRVLPQCRNRAAWSA